LRQVVAFGQVGDVVAGRKQPYHQARRAEQQRLTAPSRERNARSPGEPTRRAHRRPRQRAGGQQLAGVHRVMEQARLARRRRQDERNEDLVRNRQRYPTGELRGSAVDDPRVRLRRLGVHPGR
jgi:hypothetical protein